MTFPGPIEHIDGVALDVYRYGLTERGTDLLRVAQRLNRHMVAAGWAEYEPQRVSDACKRLVRLGWVEQRPWGYRRRRAKQTSFVSLAARAAERG